jgi:glycosyltransferase involved in cell wall biosynthesis
MIQIVLVGNYSKDKQESMNRFVNVLANGLNTHQIQYSIWNPIILFGYFFKTTNSGIGKWVSYTDKYFITPIVFYLRVFKNFIINKKVIYHICDHSNAVYVPIFPTNKVIVTCHDVLAIRGALGFKDAFCNSSNFGKNLQKNILKNLSKNIHISFVSKNTLKQFKEVSLDCFSKNYQVVYNGLNANFNKLSRVEIENLKTKHNNFPSSNFILHVGSNLERKNRKLLVNMLHELNNNYKGIICFAGQKPNDEVFNLATQLNLINRIYFIEKPNHELLNLLYNTCDAFVFPSFSEGFGWPIIEAQTCGAPVICSNIEPMPEIGGEGVLTANPNSAKAFSEQFLSINNNDKREKLIQLGFENAKQFSTQKMINNYIHFYENI